MKAAELEGDWLDYWTAKGLGYEPKMMINGCAINKWRDIDGRIVSVPLWDFGPSRRWRDGGTIIEREEIGFHPMSDGKQWLATDYQLRQPHAYGQGPTPLIAAMRCYVAMKFGDEVPDEL